MKFPFLLSLPAFLFFISPVLLADDFVVVNANDSGTGSLRQAIDDALASSGVNTITFDVATMDGAEIEMVSGPFMIGGGAEIIIDGDSLVTPVSIRGNSVDRLFEVAGGAELELIGLTLEDGVAPDGIGGLDGVSGTHGMDGGNGGAIYNQGKLVLVRCLLQENLAGNGGDGGKKTGADPGMSGNGGRGGQGGAIYSVGINASVELTETILRQNKAGDGGSSGSRPDKDSGSVGVAGKGGSGGAVYAEGGLILINQSTLESNQAGRGGGGGISVGPGRSGQGGSGGDGGAIAFVDSQFTMTDSTLQDNKAGPGFKGGEEMDGSDFFGDGGHGGDGGALWGFHFPAATTPQVTNSFIGSNRAGSGANGGNLPPAGLTGVSIDGGIGGKGGSGGGLFLVGKPGVSPVWTMTNTTIYSNSSGDGGFGGNGADAGLGGRSGDAGNGGGIAFSHDGGDYTAFLAHVTLYVNHGGDHGLTGLPDGGGLGDTSSGGGIWEFPGGINGGSGVTLANTVVSANDADIFPNLAPGFLSQGINITATSINSKLGIPSDNGGPTLSIPLLPGSPLIDGGGTLTTPLLTDQRGVARPFNDKPDIGAYESELVPEVEPPSTPLRQPDLRIGVSPDPATHQGDDAYTSTGAGPILPVKLKTAKAAKFYLSLQNDGSVLDTFTLAGSPANKTLKLTALSLTGGTVNVTAQLRLGYQVANLQPEGTALFQISVKARSKKKRARQLLSYSARSSDASRVDTVLAKVSQKKAAKKKN